MVLTDCTLDKLYKPGKEDKSMKKAFYSWCLTNYTYRDITLTARERAGFTDAYAVAFFQDPNEEPGATKFHDMKDEAEKADFLSRINFLPSAKYIKAKPKSASDNAKIALRKALTPDQTMSNTVIANQFRAKWRKAAIYGFKLAWKELVLENVGGGGEESKQGDDEQKEDGDGDSDDPFEGLDIPDPTSDDAMKMDHRTFKVSLTTWRNFLYKHGIGVLEGMIEEDEELLKEKKNKDLEEKMNDAGAAYEGFMKKKDMLRIRMPVEPERVVGGVWKPPRMDFSSSNTKVVRPKKTAIPTNTVELMRNEGYKYVHALKMGQQGGEGDLESCQKKLLERGKVYKENFKEDKPEDADWKFGLEKTSNNMAKAIEKEKQIRRDGCVKSFEVWRIKKEVSERAINAVACIEKPTDVKLWIDVGKALKAIDRNLYSVWFKWTSDFQSGYKCQVLWDYFPPKVCDVHSAAYSGMRETFLKLLRPGLDYEKVFFHQCERKYYKLMRHCDETEKDFDEELKKELGLDDKEKAKELKNDPSRRDFVKEAEKKIAAEFLQDGDQRAEDLMLDAEKKQEQHDELRMRNMFEMNKQDMRRIMSDLGVKMEEEQLRRLIDAFDTNGDGKVSKSEFVNFCNPSGVGTRPLVRGDTAAVLERKCICETTCRFTGMPNAFVVTASKKKTEGEDNVRIVKKKDGSFRRIVELEERGKRWAILKSFNLHKEMDGDDLKELDEEEFSGKCEQAAWDTLELYDSKKGSKGDDDYSDDEEDESGEEHNKRVKMQKRALRVLLNHSSENRAALTLKAMMDKGKPPPAPELWAAEVGDPEVGDGLDVLCDSLLLRWRAKKGSLVAFFSLEMSGPLGSKEQLNNDYREIFRDPPDADHEAQFQHWVATHLTPNTTYSFRIRAFNGFGGGPYVRKDFTTQPVAPPTPVLVKASINTVTIKWKFGTKTAQSFSAFKKAFSELAQGGSKVSRNGLIVALERNHNEVLQFLNSATISSGATIFDAIESNGDNYISMSEIERYQQQISGDEKYSGNVDASRTKYVVERCASQQDDEYEQVWRGSAGEAEIKALEPHSTNRFRVFAVNVDGVRGAASEDICANTLMETPSDLRLTRISATTCKVSWPLVNLKNASLRMSGGSKSGGNLEKILSEWTKSGDTANDNGVSLDMVFSQFDGNNSGRIDGSDLLALLQELGVNPSEDRLREAWQEMDNSGDGTVSFKDFHAWWKSKAVTYVLERTKVASEMSSSASTVVCFRGAQSCVELSGLEPNTKYSFSLRNVCPNSFSPLSKQVEMITAPSAPLAPVTVATNDKDVLLKMYFGHKGGQKFVCERKMVSTYSGSRTVQAAARKIIDQGWVVFFEGTDPLVKCMNLIPNCKYQIRAKACNSDNLGGEYSGITNVTTMQKPMFLKATNAPEVFTIECSRDIVIGDLILFTERLFLKDDKLITGGDGVVSTKQGRDGTVTPRLSMGSSQDSRRGGKAGGTKFMGERTVAARVLSKRVGSTTQNTTKVNRSTVVRMQVIWNSVSDKKACGSYIMKEGLLIERVEDQIFNFETFRSRWEDEGERGADGAEEQV
jgi:Ca2+-binding EF-hand superfamily protein